jgi:hypothetical protein
MFMAKIFITTNGKTDYLVVPRVMATKLTKCYWVAANESVISLVDEWAIPSRSPKMPDIPVNVSEKELKKIITKTFGDIVAEREDGKDDQGWVALMPRKWEKLIDRHGIPDF